MRASTWPDFVGRIKERTKGEDIIRFHNGPWHYINVPYTPPAEKGRLGENHFRGNDPNVLVALRKSVPACSIHRAPRPQRKPSVWPGCCTWWATSISRCTAQQWLRASIRRADRGGNDHAVRGEGDPKRLHAYWDDLLGGDSRYENVAELARSIVSQPEHNPQQLSELVDHKVPADWVEEGFALAKSSVYLDGKLPRADFHAWESGKITTEQVPPLPDGYEANSRRVARRRVALAAYRLAHELAGFAR